MIEDTTAVAGKAELTIHLAQAPAGHLMLAVVDGQGNGGGNVKIKPGRKMKFKNATGFRCTLLFLEITDADEPDPGCDMSRWIFEDPRPGEPVPVDCSVELPVGYTWKPTLKTGIDLAVKYTVTLLEKPDVPPLDPIIIVRP